MNKYNQSKHVITSLSSTIPTPLTSFASNTKITSRINTITNTQQRSYTSVSASKSILVRTSTLLTAKNISSIHHTRSFSAPPLPKSKVYNSPEEALKQSGLKSGDVLLVGGFGLCGIPSALIDTITRLPVNNLTVVSNNAGTETHGLGKLLASKQTKRMISSYVGENGLFERMYLNGELEVELTPQGTLAERMRAAGAGIPAFYTHTGYGTLVEKGGAAIKWGPNLTVAVPSPKKETREFNGKGYVLEHALHGDVAIIKAWKADKYGNLVFRGTSENFNPECAMAGKFTIAEVEEIVELGEIKPEHVQLQGIFIDAIVKANEPKLIERVTTRSSADAPLNIVSKKKSDAAAQETRIKIAKRAAQEFKDGMNVNLGIGMPTLASNFLPKGVSIMLHTENGLLGMGPYPLKGEEDADFVNAGKETITVLPGSSLFSASTSFGMIRGGNLDLTMLGSMQVSAKGDIANWIIPGKMVKGMGGAMDLVSSGSRVVVIMEHTAKGAAKILTECSLPVTGLRVANRIITELAVFDIDPTKGLTLIEISPDTTLEHVKSVTEASFEVSPNLKKISI